MMASSQVEMAMSSPFGCTSVHNRRDSCFQNNLNDLVTSCIPNDGLTDLWVHHPQWQTATTATTSNTKCNDTNYDDGSIDYNNPVKARVHNHKDNWARAREIIFPVDHGSNPPKQSMEVSNLGGVSSLVQKWRGFEAKGCSSSKNNSASTMLQDKTGHQPPPLVIVTNTNTKDDDSFGDWESDRTAISGPPSCRGRDFDFTESERLKVADIIRKLTEDRLNDVGSDSPPRVRTSWDPSEQSQSQRCLFPVVASQSPRIRGRQAYIDLLMQMERDRRKELEGLVGRKAVSNFSHRGRIQALLRIKFLRRYMEPKEDRHSNTTLSESHKSMQTRFRERVNPSAQNSLMHSESSRKEQINDAPTALNSYTANQIGNENKCQEVTDSKSCHTVREDHIKHSEDSIAAIVNDIHHSSPLEANESIQQNTNVFDSCEHLHHEASLFSIFRQQESNRGSSNDSLAKSAETARTFHNLEISLAETAKSLYSNENNEHNKEDKATDHQVTETNYDLTSDCANPHSYHEGQSSRKQHMAETDRYWVSNVANPEVGWEKMQSDYQQKEVNNRDWIDEVSRPRSAWEDLRQARYEEMLDPFFDNEEIRVLLSRKSVSTFLSSSMREKIDQVMICRSQGQQSVKNNQTQEEKHDKLPEQGQAVVSEEGKGRNGEDEQNEEGEDYGDYFDEYEEAESSMGQQYNESNEYMDRITSSPPALWPQDQSHESSDYYGQVTSPSIQQSPSNYYSQDNGPTSSYRAHPAIEMELIYDLRRHMEQLHQEMSELRKSIKCCMDMQIKLQCSLTKEIATANHTHPDAKNGRRDPVKKATTGGRCCVCCKVQVDCLLYRCGHMCTCFKCAHELQWSSGKCPICGAPIVDAVRTYSNY